MNITLQEINEKIANNPQALIGECDNQYQQIVKNIAETIYENRMEKPIILLAGPSGSGKTTTAHMIEAYLDAKGCETHTLSMDNWFKPMSQREQEMVLEGTLDLESPERVDTTLLNVQVNKIIDCQPVRFPIYQFVDASRTFAEESFTRKEGELLILEGIHALNPDVVKTQQGVWRIYVSPTSCYVMDEEELDGPHLRLLRRMVRDQLNRGRTIAQTNLLYEGVQRGEERNIAPYRKHADFDIDTTISYELALYKPFLLEQLREEIADERINRLLKWLENVEELDRNEIDENALVREFVTKE